MQKTAQKGIAVLLVPVIIAVLVVLGFLVYKNYVSKTNLLPQQIGQNLIASPSPKAEIPTSWKTFTMKYGRVAISYPPNWLVKYIPNQYGSSQYADFFYTKGESVVSGEYVISLNVGVADQYSYLNSSQYNFVLPSLGTTANAKISQAQDITTIQFIKDGVFYTLTANLYEANRQKIDILELNSTLSQMAKSLTFVDAVASCEEPVLAPIKTFPKNFALSNRHDSDSKDPLSGYWPDISQDPNNSYYLKEDGSRTSMRSFIVTYEKDGEPFKHTDDFRKTLAPISGISTNNQLSVPVEMPVSSELLPVPTIVPAPYVDTYNTDITIILNVNCVDQWKTQNNLRLYTATEDKNYPFSIAMYASSDNPQKLWGASKWNIDLLKKTRNVVYIRIGDQWQKYTAKNYYATY